MATALDKAKRNNEKQTVDTYFVHTGNELLAADYKSAFLKHAQAYKLKARFCKARSNL